MLGYLRRNHPTRFPQQPERSRYNRRRGALGEALNTPRRHVVGGLLAQLPTDERPVYILDSLPVPVVGFHHARDDHACRGWASYGDNATKKQTLYGFKLHVITTAEGSMSILRWRQHI